MPAASTVRRLRPVGYYEFEEILDYILSSAPGRTIGKDLSQEKKMSKGKELVNKALNWFSRYLTGYSEQGDLSLNSVSQPNN